MLHGGAPAFAPDGRHLAALDVVAGTTRMVDVATGKTVARSSACPHPHDVAFTKKGNLLAVTGRTDAYVFEMPLLKVRWRVMLQSEKAWESVDYHNDFSIGGFVGDDTAVVFVAAPARSRRALWTGTPTSSPSTRAQCRSAAPSPTRR